MKTMLLLPLWGILAQATFGADEPTHPPMLQPGKDYALNFVDNSRMSMSQPVKVLAHPQNGWVRIEFTPRVTTIRDPAGRTVRSEASAAKPGEKRQVWLNLAHVVTIREWEAPGNEAGQPAAERIPRTQ